LIALDPHTGQIRALVGGRNYGVSQLNHVPGGAPAGSISKPLSTPRNEHGVEKTNPV